MLREPTETSLSQLEPCVLHEDKCVCEDVDYCLLDGWIAVRARMELQHRHQGPLARVNEVQRLKNPLAS